MLKEDFMCRAGAIGYYRGFVWGQASKLKVDEIIQADLGAGNAQKFRMNLSQYSIAHKKKFKTRIKKSDGNLYILRVL